jgi:3-ketosteroid 9alpha-monooxygenase subunit A
MMAKAQEYGLGEFTFPRGWFMIAAADELQQRPLALRFFGQDLVLYRGRSGRVVLLDAYCAHMGTHLAKNDTSYVVRDGQIEGDSIRCPYHAWRFGPDGRCDDIPYYKGPIPKAACIRSWPVVERMGCVFMWHDPEGGLPDYDLPHFAEWDDPRWVRWKIDHLGELTLHPTEVLDNMADVAHLGPVHGSTVEYFENEFQDHIVIQRQGGGHRTLASGAGLLSTDTWYTGPGILNSRLTGGFETIMLITHTPVDDGTVKAWHALLVKSPHDVATEEDIVNARAFQETSRLAFAQDFDVWMHKKPCFNPLQLPTDGPFHKVRQWYRQFYNPRAQAREVHKQLNGVHVVKGMAAAPQRAAAG